MTIRKVLTLVVCCFILNGCREKSVKWSIVTAIEKECQQADTCTVDLKGITNFAWDKLYLFDVSGADDVDTVLGFHYPYFEDVASRIIFVKNNQVVYHEDEYPNPDKPPIANITFNLGGAHAYVCTPKNATFGVKKTTEDKYSSYVLTPVKQGK